MKSNKVGLGIIGEKFSDSVAKSIFKVKEGYRVIHVDWDNYSYGYGLDLRVFKRNKQVMAIEVKNWREMNRPYGTETARTEIIDRFRNYAGGLKVLIVSFLCLLTKKALELLETHNIHIIEMEKLVGRKDFPRKGKNNEVFYQLKNKLQKLWLDYRHNQKQTNPRFLGCVSQFKLDNYVSTTNTIELNKHDNDSRKQLVKTHQNSLVERILNLAKQDGNKENQYEAHGFQLI
ncbi:MAG: hypothetical protein OEZ35_05790 [Candidatus Bathyarchaeota archaeon]|nr:hypothetical protein [Candidatus Bathyarchaeota archaeon]